MIRAFIAVPGSPEVVRAAAHLRAQCCGIHRAVRWVAPDRIHLTLRFLGDVGGDRLPAVSDLLAGAAATTSAFRLSAGGLGVFPSIKRPRVLWMGVTGETPALVAFARRLDSDLAGLGFPTENRPFRAHLTLGRFTAMVDPRLVADTLLATAGAGATPFTGAQVVLFQSELKPSGAVYIPLAAFPLTAGHAAPPAPGRCS